MSRGAFVVGTMLWAVALAAVASAAQPDCVRRVLIVTGQSDEPHHDWRETTAAIREVLARTGRFEVFVNEEPRGLTPEALTGYQAVLVNYHGPRWPRGAEQALESFVRSGGGLFAFHLSAYGPFFGMRQKEGRWQAGDAGWTAWSEMIGARWEPGDIGHAPRGPFEVRWREGSRFGSNGNARFSANDELYHKIELLPGTEVEATAVNAAPGAAGREEPMIWINRFGKGRVFFTTLGHDATAFHQPGMRSSVAAGMWWAAAGGAAGCAPKGVQPVRLLVVTGGHSYPTDFYEMLNSLDGVSWTHAASHSEAFGEPLEEHFDAILLHDMLDETTPRARERLRAFVEAGKGVVSVHHAIVDYTDWPWWYREVTGGKFFIKAGGEHPASRYREDVDFVVTPVPERRNHPVLAGVGPLTVYDEVYRGMWLSPRADVLMETTHPENDRPVVYVGPHPRARVVYIQLGHSAGTMHNPGFRRLVRNAIRWTARRVD